MDQGLAAIIGAGVGFAGATFVSIWAGRQSRWQIKAQLRGQHLHWRRESRRTTFADLMKACGDLQDTCKQATATFANRDVADEVAAQHKAAVEQRYAAFLNAHIAAQLEAPTLDALFDDLVTQHLELTQHVREFMGRAGSLPHVINAGAAAAVSTGRFLAHAQRALNDYEDL